MLFSRIRNKLITLCGFIMFLCFALALHSISATAAGTLYLEIKPGDLVCSGGKVSGETYILTFEYEHDSITLPHTKYDTYALAENTLLTANNGTDKVELQSVKGNGNPKSIYFVFSATVGNGYTAFSDAITSFTFSNSLIIDASAKYCNNNPNGYQGIQFVGDMTFERNGASWVCVSNSDDEEESGGGSAPDTDLDGKNEYTCDLQGASSAPVWNSTQKTLSVNITLPYKATETLVYTGTPEIIVEGVEYDGEIIATQEADTNILRLDFCDAEVLYPGTGLSLTINDTTLTNEKLGSLTLAGSVTYYGYFDGSWSSEKLYEIIKTVDGTTQSELLDITQTSYQLPALDKISDKMALGWIYNDELYKTGETLALSSNNRAIYLTALSLGFSLESGASIRYDKNVDDSGIRFTANLQEDGYALAAPFISGLGTILMPADKLEDGKDFVYENYYAEDEGNAKILNATKNDIDFGLGGLFKLYTSIVKLNASNYNRTYCARGYITVLYKSGQTRIWTDNIEKRSIYEVSSNMLTAPREETKLLDWQIRILESYVNGVANISYDASTGTAT
ncbi:MAG: hypothetical protein J6U60_00770, partial [Clostridia bacterium]|nr:hypothetical protein [Clostridia bacterium]